MKKRLLSYAILFFPFLFQHHLQAQTAKSLLWEISGNGLSEPSYLYGTMHVGDKRVHDLSDATVNAFKQADAYAGELNLENVDRMAVLNLMKLDSGKHMNDFFTPEEWTTVETYFSEKARVNVNDFKDYKIFFLYSLATLAGFKNQKGQALDEYFYHEAKRQSKVLLGLETAEEQMLAIDSAPIEEQKTMLLKMMQEDGKDGDRLMKKMLKYYVRQDLDKLQQLTADDSEMGSKFEELLVVKRNHNMAERMVPLMEKQSTFVAVGALHLVGDEGVINLLRGMGYKVAPLNTK